MPAIKGRAKAPYKDKVVKVKTKVYTPSRIKISSAKEKGRRLQQWVRDMILFFFTDLELEDVLSTSMGAPGEDIKLSPAARKVFPYSIECKARATIGIYDYYEQAKANAKEHEPVVFIKADYKKTLAIVDATHFVQLVKDKHNSNITEATGTKT